MSRTMEILEALRKASESDDAKEGWRTVYLDNAKSNDINDKSFRSHLAELSKLGYYKPQDGYAFGSVKMK